MTSAPSVNAKHWIGRDQSVLQHPGGGGGENTIVFSHGEGARLWDIDGREYLDAQGGAWVNTVGYGRSELAAVAARQMERLAHFSIGFDYANIPAIEFAERLIARAPRNLSKVRFMNSGGEANDHALQLARLYHSQKGHPKRRRVLVHREAYHGGTYGGVQLAGGRGGVASNSDDVVFLTAPRPYHAELYGGRDMAEFCVDELRSTISEHGPEQFAAMFGELAAGFGGMVQPPDDYWPAMTAVLREHGILFIADEVVTAFGRAGSWFTSSHYGLAPDMIVLAKGISSGYMPMAALLMDQDVAETVNGMGPGNSYAGHAVGAAVASAHIDIIEREDLLENSVERGKQFLEELAPLSSHPLVGDIRGRGLMIGIELVASKETRKPLTGAAPWLNVEFPRYVRNQHGVLLGIRSSAIILTPPLVITADDVTQICGAVIDAVGKIDTRELSFPKFNPT